MQDETSPELQVVLPVHNESSVVASVVNEWCGQLDRCSVRYVLAAIDDGSTDDTRTVLAALQRKWGQRLEVVHQENRGHGQTALRGYRLAADRRIPWVFQIDSDGQCDPVYFPRLWEAREGHDIISAYRIRRGDGRSREWISFGLRWFIFLLSGTYCRDANVPYRLMRTASITPLLGKIPPTFSLANVALAILARRARLRHYFVPITFRARQGGSPAVSSLGFAVKAIDLYKSLRDAVASHWPDAAPAKLKGLSS